MDPSITAMVLPATFVYLLYCYVLFKWMKRDLDHFPRQAKKNDVAIGSIKTTNKEPSSTFSDVKKSAIRKEPFIAITGEDQEKKVFVDYNESTSEESSSSIMEELDWKKLCNDYIENTSKLISEVSEWKKASNHLVQTTKDVIAELVQEDEGKLGCDDLMETTRQSIYEIAEGTCKEACNDFIENTTHLISEVIDWKEVCHKFIKTTKTHISDLINADCGEKELIDDISSTDDSTPGDIREVKSVSKSNVNITTESKKSKDENLNKTYDDFMTNATQFISGITNQEKGQEEGLGFTVVKKEAIPELSEDDEFQQECDDFIETTKKFISQFSKEVTDKMSTSSYDESMKISFTSEEGESKDSNDIFKTSQVSHC